MISPLDKAVSPPPVRWTLLLFAIACGAVVLIAIVSLVDLWQASLRSPDPESVLTVFHLALSAVFVGLALVHRLVSVAFASGAMNNITAQRRFVRLLALPLLWFPVTFLGATTRPWQVLLSFGFLSRPGDTWRSVDTQLACSAVAIAGALYGWLDERASFRGWLRVLAIASLCLIGLSFVFLLGSRTITTQGLWLHARRLGPVVFACLALLVMTPHSDSIERVETR